MTPLVSDPFLHFNRRAGDVHVECVMMATVPVQRRPWAGQPERVSAIPVEVSAVEIAKRWGHWTEIYLAVFRHSLTLPDSESTSAKTTQSAWQAYYAVRTASRYANLALDYQEQESHDGTRQG